MALVTLMRHRSMMCSWRLERTGAVCLCQSFSSHGVDQEGWNLDLSDAQGEPLAIDSMREVEFLLYSDERDPIVWREVCAIALVTQPLLCKGRLMKSGWWEKKSPQMCVEHDTDVRIPMFFKGNSLCVRASIFRVLDKHEPNVLHTRNLQVRFVQAWPAVGMIDAPYGWQMSGLGHLFFRGRGSTYVDPSIIAPVGWPCRSTVVKPCQPGHEWMVLELCVQWGSLQDITAPLPHGESEIRCILSTDPESAIDI